MRISDWSSDVCSAYLQDSCDLEVLWTAHPLSEAQEEIHGRKFEFSYNKKKYQCEFGMSSERLLSLTKGIITITNASLTNHRNTESFYRYTNRRNKDNTGLSTPKSFWIRKLRLSESAAVEMIRQDWKSTRLNYSYICASSN